MDEEPKIPAAELLAPHLEESPPWHWYNGMVLLAAVEGDERLQSLSSEIERLYYTLQRYTRWAVEKLDFDDIALSSDEEPCRSPLNPFQLQLELAKWRLEEYSRIRRYIWQRIRRFSKFPKTERLKFLHGANGQYYLTTEAYYEALERAGPVAMRDAPKPKT